MSKWYDMKSMPIGDQRNIVVEVRGAPQSQALAYWTGRIWALAPISDKPADIGFEPVEYRMPPTPEATAAGDPFTDVRDELEGRRWTFEEAKALIEMILQGTAHLPTPPDPDHGKIAPGHVCKHGIRWPHACTECDEAAWAAHVAADRPSA